MINWITGTRRFNEEIEFLTYLQEHHSTALYEHEKAHCDALHQFERKATRYAVTRNKVRICGLVSCSWTSAVVNHNPLAKGWAGLRELSAIALAPQDPSLSDWITGILWYDVRNLRRDVPKIWRKYL
ncbi:hypothetical protein EXS73_00250 [Candidatus Pacearchaeota archaeon]|nr:hypothetical protein [Candidatus Pacearchaeota archaeon]